MDTKSQTIEAYISSFPEHTQALLNQIRETIKKLVPQAQEVIAYGIPTFKLNGNLVHFAGYNNHIGFYPGSKAILIFQQALAGYKSAKGTVQFPLGRSLPLDLISQITSFCIEQNKEKKARKKT